MSWAGFVDTNRKRHRGMTRKFGRKGTPARLLVSKSISAVKYHNFRRSISAIELSGVGGASRPQRCTHSPSFRFLHSPSSSSPRHHLVFMFSNSIQSTESQVLPFTIYVRFTFCCTLAVFTTIVCCYFVNSLWHYCI